MKHLFFTIIILLGFNSCIHSDLEDPIPPAKEGKVTLTTDWINRTAGIEVPTSYTVVINNQTLTFQYISNLLPQLTVGTFATLIHNTADKLAIVGTKATVSTTSNIVDPQPGWLFSSTLDISYVLNQDKTYTATMKQEVRQLTFTLKPEGTTTSKITAVEATMTGVASVWNFATNLPEGTTASVKPIFEKLADGSWQATVRLLGVIGSEQKLSTTISFSDGIASISDVTDLRNKLSDFNTDKKTPLKLEAQIVETHTEAGFSASIKEWEKKTGGNVVAW